jgi:hypothetical protein
MTSKPAFQASPTNLNIKEIQTIPERRPDMPYAPAIRVESGVYRQLKRGRSGDEVRPGWRVN